ncbi:MAG TPA: HK97-gp10 family putative phage morphogenesis protein [Reyranella sp.]|nr:HK97-gp10 family putative phage morphogenesis protein [Reyranella sp.]
MQARVVGISKAVANLKQLGDAIASRVTRKAVRAATRVIMLQVKRTTYSGDRDRRTGLLGRSLSMTVSAKQGKAIVGKVVMRPVDVTGKSKVAQNVRRARKAKLGNATQMTAFYWRFLEKGTKTRATQSGANRGRVMPSPWVVPAFDAKSGEAIDVFAKIFNRETDAEARKLDKGVGR